MRVCYRGNHSVSYSTESHVALSLESLGVEVDRCQEDKVSWSEQVERARRADFMLWTQTYALAHVWETDDAREALDDIACPTIGYHLDRWWGIREDQVTTEPFFGIDLVCTADGGSDERWRAAGVNHRWFPPGVVHTECERGRVRGSWRAPMTFVGSWKDYAHDDMRQPDDPWPGRVPLCEWLRENYPRTRFWPQRRAVRGPQLADVYASSTVVVGDSCLLGGAHHYWSDRIPETLGRYGLLIHPDVEGLEGHFRPGEHLLTFPLGDFEALRATIDKALGMDEAEREAIRVAGHEHVVAHHTYRVRMQQLLALLREEGMLSA